MLSLKQIIEISTPYFSYQSADTSFSGYVVKGNHNGASD